MNEFIAVVAVVAAILQIILFFKVWGMTNDVDKLKSRFIDNKNDIDILEEKDNIALRYFIVKQCDGPEAARSYLSDVVKQAVLSKNNGADMVKEAQSQCRTIECMLGHLLADANIEVPSLNTYNEYQKLATNQLANGITVGDEVIFNGATWTVKRIDLKTNDVVLEREGYVPTSVSMMKIVKNQPSIK